VTTAAAVYAVNDIRFSIYGEGVHAGRPAVIVKLQGCSVGCAFCDCRETWERECATQVDSLPEMHRRPEGWMTLASELVAGYSLGLLPETMRVDTETKSTARGALAVVTGGEPAEQDLRPMARDLRAAGFYTLLETSGTADGFVDVMPKTWNGSPPGYPVIVTSWRPGSVFDYVVVSPKIDQPGDRELIAAACALADEVRMIVRKPTDLPLLSAYLQNFPPKKGAQVFVQPAHRSEYTVELAVDAAKRRGWRVSVNLDKLLNIT
jgi:7-carboxy-7-deazaguanine synthase